MATDVSRAFIAAMMAEREITQGTDPTPVATTDGMHTFDSSNIWQPDYARINFRPHGNTFSRPKGITGRQLARVTADWFLQGSGTAGDETVVGFKANSAMMCAAGNTLTIAASTSLNYSPSTIALLDTFSNTATVKSGSATVWANANGMLNKINGLFGNIVMTATPESGVRCSFTGLGRYTVPAALASEFNSWTGGTLRARPFYNVNGTINNGSSMPAANWIFQQFTFDMGVQVEEVLDSNSTTGFYNSLIIDKKPTLEVTLALNKLTSAEVAFNEFMSDATGDITHDLGWVVGSTAGNIGTFAFDFAQITQPRFAENRGIRTLVVPYDLTGTGENEWSLIFT